MKHSSKGKASEKKKKKTGTIQRDQKTKTLIWKTTWVFFNIKINIFLELMLKVIQNLKDVHSFMTV